MRRITVATVLVIVFVSLGIAGYQIKKKRDAKLAETSKIALETERREAAADSEDISTRIREYWDDKHRRSQLRNDELRLKNDQLQFEIAELEDKHPSRLEIDKETTIIEHERLTIGIMDDLPHSAGLTPEEADERVLEHNKRFPHFKMADVSDITRELEDVRQRISDSSN